MEELEKKDRIARVAVLLPNAAWALPTKATIRKEFGAKKVRFYKGTGNHADIIYMLYRLKAAIEQQPMTHWDEAQNSVLVKFDASAEVNVFTQIKYVGHGLGFFRIVQTDLEEILKFESHLNTLKRLRNGLVNSQKLIAEFQDTLMFEGLNPDQSVNAPLMTAITAVEDEFKLKESEVIERMSVIWNKMIWRCDSDDGSRAEDTAGQVSPEFRLAA
jgi:hypothetical protein